MICEKHIYTKCPVPCPICVWEESYKLQADLGAANERIGFLQEDLHRMTENYQTHAELGAAKDKRIEELEAKLVETYCEFVGQNCTMQDGSLDSMAITANANAMRFLAKQGRVCIEKEYGRRVIGRWAEQALKDK